MTWSCRLSGFYGPYTMDRNNYIEIHTTQAQVAKISYHHPSKYLNQNVSPQLQYLLFRIKCLFSEKWVGSQWREDINSLYHFERIPGNIPGANVRLESEIIQYIKYHINPETDIKIKISGIGSKVSRISNFVVLSFSVISDDLILSSKDQNVKIDNKSIFCLSSSCKSWYEDLLDDE
jgi:hypothetical protein